MTRAFVLSGGGSHGALQVGALQALLAHDIKPDILVGVSAGALNAAWLAANPHLSGVSQLARLWRDSVPKVLLPPTRLQMLLRIATGKGSLLSNQPLLRLIRRLSPDGASFESFKQPRLYVVAVHMPDGRPRVFGDDPADLLIDGLMASTAIPPLYPPWEIGGEKYADGGICCDLPLQIAVERGADEIFALYAGHLPETASGDVDPGMLTIGGQAIRALVHRNVQLEIQVIRRIPQVKMHLIHLVGTGELGFWDFTAAETLLATGRQIAENYLADNLSVAPSLISRIRSLSRRWLDQLVPANVGRKLARPENLVENR